ncbi:hypothetical protein WJX84_006711 [Apatococcus fuscideae]|uniref:RNA polymerase sigma-70 domain-containing protein n=1 Tax=Apatococcus fuscideae TaxID=2026836 RepID=A0AAW1TLD0_9CHLO
MAIPWASSLATESRAQDVTEEWSLFNRRRHVVKTVTDLTSGVLQAMEEIGALGQPGFSAHDQQMLKTERAKRDNEQKQKAQKREKRKLQEASRRMAAAWGKTTAAEPAAEPAVASQAAAILTREPEINVSHISLPDNDVASGSSISFSSPSASLPEVQVPSISLFGGVAAPQQQQTIVSSSSASVRGPEVEAQRLSNSHATAARRSSRPVGQRSARLRATAASAKLGAELPTSKPAKKKAQSPIDKNSFPMPDNFGYMGSNHKLLSADEEKHLAYKIQAILPYEEKFEELHRQNVAAAGIDLETQAESGRPNASHPDVEAGKFNPSFREWAVACDRADDMQAFEHEIWSGRQARLKMLECNQRLVRSVARHFKNRGVAAEDLIMEGVQGLRRGIDKFDPAKGFKFSTYAHWWIRQAISRCICDQGRVLKVPYHICDLIAKIRKIEREMKADGRDPQPHQVAKKMGISVNRYHEILQGDSSTYSLEQPLSGDRDSKSLDDLIEDDGPSMNELVVHGGLISDVNNLLHTLSPREQGVLRLRYGLDGQGERTLDDIGRFFKVTRERVRQVETKALLKLRQPTRSDGLKEYTRANTAQLTWGQSGALGKKSS